MTPGLSHPATCGILVLWPEIEPASLALEDRLLTSGLPGKSLRFYSKSWSQGARVSQLHSSPSILWVFCSLCKPWNQSVSNHKVTCQDFDGNCTESTGDTLMILNFLIHKSGISLYSFGSSLTSLIRAFSTSVIVLLISSISFQFLLRISSSAYMACCLFFSVRALSIWIIVVLNSCLIIPRSLALLMPTLFKFLFIYFFCLACFGIFSC